MAELTPRADRQVVPSNFTTPPPGTPVVGPGGGPSEQDQVRLLRRPREPHLRPDLRLRAARPRRPALPALRRQRRPRPDRRRDAQRARARAQLPAARQRARELGGVDRRPQDHRGRLRERLHAALREHRAAAARGNPDIFPIGIPPNAFVFDQAVRQGVSFRIYGELGAGNQPFADDGRPTFDQVLANTDPAYPSQVQGTCRPGGPGAAPARRCSADALHRRPPARSARRPARPTPRAAIAHLRRRSSSAQVAAGTVPRFNYLILFNDHTDGTTPGVYTPKANVADNDLALGQLVELVSQSSIWARERDPRRRGRLAGRHRLGRRAPHAGVRDLAVGEARRRRDLARATTTTRSCARPS